MRKLYEETRGEREREREEEPMQRNEVNGKERKKPKMI